MAVKNGCRTFRSDMGGFRILTMEERIAFRENFKAYRIAQRAKQRACLLNATPPWLTKQHFKDIEAKYKEAARLGISLQKSFHVDHIIPLRHSLVCGLHVAWNLQVLEKSENLKKSNSFIIV